MGEKQNVEATLFYSTEGQFEKGQPIITVDNTDLTPYLTPDDDGEWMMIPPKLDGVRISGTFKLPKNLRCIAESGLSSLLCRKAYRETRL